MIDMAILSAGVKTPPPVFSTRRIVIRVSGAFSPAEGIEHLDLIVGGVFLIYDLIIPPNWKPNSSPPKAAGAYWATTKPRAEGIRVLGTLSSSPTLTGTSGTLVSETFRIWPLMGL